MIELARSVGDPGAARAVPACPGWTVRDLLAHVTSIASSLASGAFPADLNPSAFWDAQMATRRETFIEDALAERAASGLPDLLEEWQRSAGVLEAMMRGLQPWPSWGGASELPAWILVTDLAVHHHDLRGAIEQPGDRDSLATGLSLRSYVEGMRMRARIEQLPPFRIVAGARSWTIGEGDPVATVSADPFELARAASGRRSREQVRACDWDGDPEPVLICFFPYGYREAALVE